DECCELQAEWIAPGFGQIASHARKIELQDRLRPSQLDLVLKDGGDMLFRIVGTISRKCRIWVGFTQEPVVESELGNLLN
ncbi:hypothetical protein AAHH78_39105, partial [Burkholderia pseudomallei]